MNPTVQTETAILRRVLGTTSPALSREAAQSLLTLAFPVEDYRRMRALAAKARAGHLTRRDHKEINAYGVVGSLLSVLKSKARSSLKVKS